MIAGKSLSLPSPSGMEVWPNFTVVGGAVKKNVRELCCSGELMYMPQRVLKLHHEIKFVLD